MLISKQKNNKNKVFMFVRMLVQHKLMVIDTISKYNMIQMIIQLNL